ncbi:MAG: transporter substrate-binding domain-containing protein [Hyphomicrobiaceae bacterium]|nr:transporter substrate-binding domain-containing protein [Hyphomicrobiaceae bacterium]MCC0024540.1 transporter substrate-binding domain-containing protein [Hyphomicrobiaceae bacterium]
MASLLLLSASVAASLAQDDPVVASTLDKVRDRGFLVCGSSDDLPGFAQMNSSGQWVGFDVDFCRAIAAATLGDANKVEFRSLDGEGRFAPLQTGSVDVMVRDAVWTMARDTQFGVRFVATSFFDGLTFLVRGELGIVSAYLLDDVDVCVAEAGDDRRRMNEFFFENQATFREVVYESREDLAIAYQAGLCDAIAAPASVLQAIRRTLPDPAQHRIMPEFISKAPYGPVVRAGDDQWADIVAWVYYAIINAEELGVSQLNLESMQSSRTPAIRRLLGLEENLGAELGLSNDWAAKAIAAVGNYREIFDRNFGAQTGASMVRGLNANWTTGGLLYAPPVL